MNFLLPIFLLGIIPVLTDFLADRYQVSIQDLVLPLILALISSIIIVSVFWGDYKKNKLAAIIPAALAILIIQGKYEQNLSSIINVDNSIVKIILSLTFFVIIIVLGKLTFRLLDWFIKQKKWKINESYKVVLIVIGVAFFIQFFSAAKALITEWHQFFYRPPKQQTQTSITDKGKPDIYYIVLDRYTNQNVLKEQFDFDNSDFLNFLQKNNFFVKPDAKSNYPYTTMSIASTLNTNYVTDIVNKFGKKSLQTTIPYHNAIQYSSVIEQLKFLGYIYYHLGTWFEATNRAPLSDYYFQKEGQLYIFNQRITLNEFSKKEMKKGFYWRFIEHGIKIGNFRVLTYNSWDEKNETLYKLDVLKNLVNQVSGNRFIFAHLLVPHDPYFFNADGSLSKNVRNDSVGKPIKQKYIDQLQFVNSQIKSIISQILLKSNNQAIIILQSDEGPYPMQLNGGQSDWGVVGKEIDFGDMNKWSDMDLQMKYGILAAYHLPGAKNLEEGADPVNIFRLVFNTYFGSNLPYLPKCYYDFPKGQEQSFNFTNITKRLTGQENPACP